MEENTTIRAAGGAIVRTTPDARHQVLLVHRPKYDDWSWPKGKCEASESLGECAVREVREETGILTRTGSTLCELAYRDQNNRPKHVTYFALTAIDVGDHPPDDEVDQLAWIDLDDVDQRLTNPDDTKVTHALRSYLARPLG